MLQERVGEAPLRWQCAWSQAVRMQCTGTGCEAGGPTWSASASTRQATAQCLHMETISRAWAKWLCREEDEMWSQIAPGGGGGGGLCGRAVGPSPPLPAPPPASVPLQGPCAAILS